MFTADPRKNYSETKVPLKGIATIIRQTSIKVIFLINGSDYSTFLKINEIVLISSKQASLKVPDKKSKKL